MVEVGNAVQFVTDNGGELLMILPASRLDEFGIRNGWALWDDLYLNPYNDMTLDVSGGYTTKATIEHLTGDPVLNFNLTSREVGGKTDIKATNLKPDAPYRLLFDGVLAKSSTGRAHAKTDNQGRLQFNEVIIPNE